MVKDYGFVTITGIINGSFDIKSMKWAMNMLNAGNPPPPQIGSAVW